MRIAFGKFYASYTGLSITEVSYMYSDSYVELFKLRHYWHSPITTSAVFI